MKTHPSAIISSKARLDDGVEIGPYVLIDGEVEIHSGTIVQSHAVIEGLVQIGRNNWIGHGAVIGTRPQDLTFKLETRSGVEIGDGNVIRELVTIHRGTAEGSMTRVGEGNFLMAGAHLGHNCAVANNVIIANNCLLGGYVTVENAAFLGGGCVFHQFMRVGQLAIAQGASAFSKDIPPFCLAAERNTIFGLNVIGLRRAGLNPAQRAEIKRAFELLYASGRNVSQALAEARSESWSEPAQAFFDFVAQAKKRGICQFKRHLGEGEESTI